MDNKFELFNHLPPELQLRVVHHLLPSWTPTVFSYVHEDPDGNRTGRRKVHVGGANNDDYPRLSWFLVSKSFKIFATTVLHAVLQRTNTIDLRGASLDPILTDPKIISLNKLLASRITKVRSTLSSTHPDTLFKVYPNLRRIEIPPDREPDKVKHDNVEAQVRATLARFTQHQVLSKSPVILPPLKSVLRANSSDFTADTAYRHYDSDKYPVAQRFVINVEAKKLWGPRAEFESGDLVSITGLYDGGITNIQVQITASLGFELWQKYGKAPVLTADAV